MVDPRLRCDEDIRLLAGHATIAVGRMPYIVPCPPGTAPSNASPPPRSAFPVIPWRARSNPRQALTGDWDDGQTGTQCRQGEVGAPHRVDAAWEGHLA